MNDGTSLDRDRHDRGAIGLFLHEPASRPRARQIGHRRARHDRRPAARARIAGASQHARNTLEGLPLFLGGLWLFAIYWNECVAAGLGVVWIAGRLIYAAGYMADPGKRSTGFLIQFAASGILLLGALGKIVYSLVAGA
ncbi:MAG: MAPEG family protein [Sphingomonadales bacterium]|nr:MAPEG family protein [Sphingomonadales bacterium]